MKLICFPLFIDNTSVIILHLIEIETHRNNVEICGNISLFQCISTYYNFKRAPSLKNLTNYCIEM